MYGGCDKLTQVSGSPCRFANVGSGSLNSVFAGNEK